MAKTRKQLPYLPYPRQDVTQVINQHLHGSSGFTPVAIGSESHWWLPSDDDADGTSTVTDRVGSVDLTLTHATAADAWVTDLAKGGARALDFAGNWAHGSIESPSFPFSVSAWVYVPSLAENISTIVFGDVSANNQSLSFGMQGGSGFWQWNYSGSFLASNGGTPSIDWHAVAIVWSSSTDRKLYVDGVLVDTWTDSIALPTGLDSIRFAAIPRSGPPLQSTCKLDDLRYFASSALSAGQVSSLHAQRGGS